MSRVIFLICLMILCGCAMSSTVELTFTDPYSRIVGAEYRVISEVNAYGIYKDMDRKAVSYIELIPGVGIAGPEVAFKKRIDIDQKIITLSAWREGKLLYDNVYYVVALHDDNLPHDIQVRIDLSRGNEGEGAELNPRVYEKIKRSGE